MKQRIRSSALKANASDDYLESLNPNQGDSKYNQAENQVNEIKKIMEDASKRGPQYKMQSYDESDLNAAKSKALQNSSDPDTTVDESNDPNTQPKMKNPFGLYSYVVLFLLFLIRLTD